MTLPHKADSGNKETRQSGSLLARWLGSTDAAVKYRIESDRQEAARLRLAIARGAEHDRPADPDKPVVIVQSPASGPPIDKGKLASWIRSEIKQAVRPEVASVAEAIESSVAEAIEERFMLMEDRRQ